MKSETLLKYYRAEQDMPQWYKDSTRVKNSSESQFLEFCGKCKAIYELEDCALLYCEDRGNGLCEIHFSLLRGSAVPVEALNDVKQKLLSEFDSVFGWVLRQNRGLQKVCRELGMETNGVEMIDGNSHGKVLNWLCYRLSKEVIAL